MLITGLSRYTVSIIIPVYNNKVGLKSSLEGIRKQSLDKNQFEVIIIDNGSDDNPEEVIKLFNDELDLIFIKEDRFLNSPYSCRNRGIEVSKGNILVLLDSTCKPTENWLIMGIRAIESGADLVGGNVEFDISEESPSAEIYDSLSHVRMEESIDKRQSAMTTNLFIKKSVFDNVGAFPEGLRSGGDIRWTFKATHSGYKLIYSEEAKVIMKPRGFVPLVRKQFRVGKGHPEIWKESGSIMVNLFKKVILCWMPPNPVRINEWIRQSNRGFIKRYFVQLFLVGWSLRLVNGAGNMVGLFNSFKQR